MKRNLIVPGLVLSLLMMGQVVRAAEPQNLLKNAGFENIEPYTVPEKWQGKMEATEMPTGWRICGWAYPGNLTVIYDAITSHGGSKYVKVDGYRTRRQGGSHFFNVERFAVSPDKKYVIKVWAKGKGDILLGVYGYSKPSLAAKFIPSGIASGWMQVTKDWKEYKLEFDTKSKPDIKGISIYFAIVGSVYLDDAYFAPLPTE